MITLLKIAAYLSLSFVLCWVGKWAYGLLHPKTRVDRELTAKDNLAFAVPLGAYYLGILIVMGGPLSGPGRPGLLWELASVGAWGLLAVTLLNVSMFADRRILFRGIDLTREIFSRKNLAAGTVVAGATLANALIVLGALTGEGGPVPAVSFWLCAQALLAAAAALLAISMRFNLASQIRKGNQAVALAHAGTSVAMGNILRMSIAGPFEGWSAGLASLGYGAGGLALLFAVRQGVHWLLLPGVTIRHELLEQKVPNVGVGYLVSLFEVAVSFLIGWCL